MVLCTFFNPAVTGTLQCTIFTLRWSIMCHLPHYQSQATKHSLREHCSVCNGADNKPGHKCIDLATPLTTTLHTIVTFNMSPTSKFISVAAPLPPAKASLSVYFSSNSVLFVIWGKRLAKKILFLSFYHCWCVMSFLLSLGADLNAFPSSSAANINHFHFPHCMLKRYAWKSVLWWTQHPRPT